ncbi:unnamed protein product [Arctogadus glacialis]
MTAAPWGRGPPPMGAGGQHQGSKQVRGGGQEGLVVRVGKGQLGAVVRVGKGQLGALGATEPLLSSPQPTEDKDEKGGSNLQQALFQEEALLLGSEAMGSTTKP